MGDNAFDAYSIIRNAAYASVSNNTRVAMQNMVSNDIQNVTISGLP